VSQDVSTLVSVDNTTVVSNLLQSFVNQCRFTLNGVSGLSSKDIYIYSSYLETLLTYGHDASQGDFTNAYWYPDEGDFSPHYASYVALNRG